MDGIAIATLTFGLVFKAFWKRALQIIIIIISDVNFQTFPEVCVGMNDIGVLFQAT